MNVYACCVCCVCCVSNIFYIELSPKHGVFFITHFSICHSFLDSYIRALPLTL